MMKRWMLKPESKLMRAIFGEPVEDKGDDNYRQKGLRDALMEALDSIEVLGGPAWRKRYKRVILLRFGFESSDGRGRTLEEVGKEFGLSRERIREIEAKALRLLRHPVRTRMLKLFIKGGGSNMGKAQDEFQTCKQAFVRDFRDMLDHFEHCWLEMDNKLDAANTSWRLLLELLYKEKLDSTTKQDLDSVVGAAMLHMQAERVLVRKQIMDINRDMLARFESARTPEELLQAAEEIGKQIIQGGGSDA